MTLILAAVAWLLTYLLHSTVLMVGALALAALGLVRSHAARDTLWKVALVGGVVTATAQVLLQVHPYAGHLALTSHESAFVDVSGVRDVHPALPSLSSLPSGSEASRFAEAITGPAAPEREVRSIVRDLHISWPAILLNFWFIGALGFGARLLWTRIALMRALRGRRELDDEHELTHMLDSLSRSAGIRAPRLTVSQRLSGPIAFGREICLPERVLTHLDAAGQRAVLAHELGHVVRRDPAWLMVALTIESVLYLQPLNRFVRRRLRAASEYLCDDWAAERTGGMILARCLAEVAGWVKAEPAPAVAPGMAGHCSHLVSRVERLLEGNMTIRPTRWILRAGAGVLALGLVAWSVPGVAAEDLNDVAVLTGDNDAWSDAANEVATWAKPAASWKSQPGDSGSWGVVRDDGRLIVFAPGYTARLSGHGRLGFRQWGRAIAIPDGYQIRVNGELAEDDQQLCPDSRVRLVESGGDGAWELVPVRQGGAVAGHGEHGQDQAVFTLNRSADEIARAALTISQNVSVNADVQLRNAAARVEQDSQRDQAYDGAADAAIDTLLQLWARDPEAVRRAARRIARTYDRDLRPQFESLGVEVGRDLAPQLQRLTDRVGRDLTPEFARLGAELGLSIVSALGESPESGAGSSDFRDKGKPKHE